MEAIAGEAPSASLAHAEVVGVALSDVAVLAGLQPSKSATRRLIKVNGIRMPEAEPDPKVDACIINSNIEISRQLL